MRYVCPARVLCALVLAVGLTGGAHSSEANLPEGYESHVRPLLQTYCTGCHSGDAPEADLDLELPADAIDLTAQHEIWRAALEKFHTGEMPPTEEPQPSEAERQVVLNWLQQAVAQVDCGRLSQPGRVTIRRLNRAEYNNTVRDLAGVDFQPAADFPADDVGNGFDNMAEVLSLPPLLMEKYLDAADAIVTRVWQDPLLLQPLIKPINPAAGAEADPAAVAEVLQRFALRAFRRVPTAEELDRLSALYQAERALGKTPADALALPLLATLASPHFLFRIELDPEPAGDASVDDVVRDLNGFELATRLSYFLWSSMPDEALFAAAADGRLLEPEELSRQTMRMLQDPKSDALLDNFFAQWLQLRSLQKIAPDPERFPGFDESLRQAMLTETRMFAAAILREDRSILDFLDAPYTFVNERLARHYGLEGIQGDVFRQVTLDDPRRGGVLTQASILTLTSNPTRTSPVKRGKWILENMLGTPPPPPPPGVEELAEEGETELLGSLRERMEQHRANPSCAVCHTKMDALGFGFENFDAVGAWRDTDGRFPIDPSGTLPGNQAFQGPAELRRILKEQRRDQFVRCLTEKMLTYALGRELQPFDRCATDAIVQQLVTDDYRMSALIRGIVRSEPFTKRGSRGESK